jgi:hypothetical protein
LALAQVDQGDAVNQRGAPSNNSHTEAARYSRRSILRSEWMYGHGFQAPGGIAMVESFAARYQAEVL